jgi:8-oxo-dGTP pyrophosphatase MutT (NUDIX family)
MGKDRSYGGVLIDEQGRVLLRKVTNSFGGATWTFAKGRADEAEHPEETAMREVLEETGYPVQVLAPIPGTFEGSTTVNRYWLMRPVGEQRGFGWETEATRWCSPEQARTLIGESVNAMVRQRDRAVLQAALALVEEEASR